ncbi:MAG TPA: serine/threonine-protein kinase [Oryzihumus sp.]|nr:serine/threonine-protein kinase [Oryzihumus sp.]
MTTAETVAPPLAVGELLAPSLAVLEHIRRGLVLDVYEARDTTRFCRVLVKTPRPELEHDPGTLASLEHEWDVLARLTHPHMVRGYELLRPEDAAPRLVLEVLTGATFGALMDDLGRLSLRDLAQLTDHLASALRYLHSLGLLHLDVKPSNVVCDNGIAKLLDFSIARPPGTYRPGLGTRAWASPEQLAGEELTSSADVWGLGLLLHLGATGSNPYGLVDDVEGLPVTAPAPRVRSVRRLPAPVAAAMDACLERMPGDRPTLPELAAAFAPHLGE